MEVDVETAKVKPMHSRIYKPFPLTNAVDENVILDFLESPYQIGLPIKPYSPREVQNAITKLENRKTIGSDKIDSVVAKSLSKKSIVFVTLIFNSML